MLTLSYSFSTWSQWWQNYTIRKSVKQLLDLRASVVFYEQRIDLKCGGVNDAVSTKSVEIRGVTSPYCINCKEAYVSDVLYYSGSKRECSIYPQQIVDLSAWISFPDGETFFPLYVSQEKILLNDKPKIHLLIEATFVTVPSGCSEHNACALQSFGTPRAWTAGTHFALILETDIEGFCNLGQLFLRKTLSVDKTLEITRLETVEIQGIPYDMLDSENKPVTLLPVNMVADSFRDIGSFVTDVCEHGTSIEKVILQYISQTAKVSPEVTEVPLTMFHRPVFLKKNLSLMEDSKVPDFQSQRSVEERDEIMSERSVDANGGNNLKNLSVNLNEDTSTSLIAQRGSTVCSSNASQFSADTVVQESSFEISVINSIEEDVTDNASDWKSHRFGSLLLSETAVSEHAKKSKPVKHRGEQKTGKPPNVLVYSESPSSVENIKIALNFALHQHRYTIYSLTLNEMLDSPWLDQASLVVVCGNIPVSLKPVLVSYLLKHSGKLLCLCSDLLELFLPSFKTAEVKPDEVVTFSYGKWEQITLLHHIFCYQPSPHSNKFSTDESPSSAAANKNIVPSSVEIYDSDKKPHQLQVKVLAAETTWQTPTLLLATDVESDAKALFSQVHLELDPDRNEEVRGKNLRLEILADLLSQHLGMDCSLDQPELHYTPAYFLGRHELKQNFLEKLSREQKQGNILKAKSITLQFYGAGIKPPEATAHFLPVLIHDCPLTFSTVEYFENLHTQHLGRLVLYADAVTTSMHIFSGPPLVHGFTAIPRQQTGGVGRGKNSWISPEGCAMFTIQLHIPLRSKLGERLSLVQHIVALAVVSSICSQSGYEVLDLGLKWPNDIYAGGNVKIGGLIVVSCICGDNAICNVGVGVNLDNSLPTTCINDLIDDINSNNETKLAKLSQEKYFALVFNELERLLDTVQTGNFDIIFDMYYNYWLHSFAEVKVVNPDGVSERVTIIGLDEYGFLKVRNHFGAIFSVHPDGNSFNMLAGLIVPK